jgi:serine protease Do
MNSRRFGWYVLVALMLLALPLSACNGDAETTPAPDASGGDLPGKSPGDKSSGTSGTTGGVSSLEGVKDATVMIEAQGTFIDPEFGLMLNAAGSGSGFIIDPSGIAVTNNHVVTGAALLRVWVGGESEPRNAKILGVSECSDLAVIDIDGEGFPFLNWHLEDVNVGLEVYTAGFPLGDPEFTMTKGIVSKARADGESNWASVDYVLEHDASINPGNSGGPLVDTNGRVVGINYAAAFGTNQYFAIKADEALPVVDSMRAGQDVDSIGINGVAVVSDDGTLSGIWVSSVKSGSPADLAGIKAGDIVTSLEGLILSTDGTMADYCDVLRTHGSDATLGVEVLRYATSEVLEGQINGRELTTSFSFGGQSGGGDGTGTSTGAGYDSYSTVYDDTGALVVDIPSAWSDVNGAEWTEDGVTVGASIWAAPDLDGFLETWNTPGLIFDVTADMARYGGAVGYLDQISSGYMDACEYDGRYEYDDSYYIGQYDFFLNCGGTSTDYLIMTAVPSSDPGAFMVEIEVQLVSDADYEALESIQGSFDVIGALPGGSSGGGSGGYQMVTDDYNSIQVEIPTSWSDINGGAWVLDDGDVVGGMISAAPDLDAFWSSWDSSGMVFGASDDNAKLAGYIQVLDFYREDYIGSCELEGRYDYEDSLYRGKYDFFEKCGGSGGSDVMLLSAVSKDDQFAYLIVVVVQMMTEADVDALENILNSFQVIGALP